MNKEYKSFDFEIKAQHEDEEFYLFEGYASTFGNVDRGNDVIQKGAFERSLKEMMPKLLWQHSTKEPIGIFTEAREDEIGLFVKGKLPKEDTFVSGRVMPQLKIGSINSLSIGFTIKDAEIIDLEDDFRRIIKEVDLWEASLVTIPMNPKATITSFKGLDIQRDDLNGHIETITKFKEIEKVLGEFGINNEEAKTIISRIKSIARDEQADRDEQALLRILNDEVKQLNNVLKKIGD